MVRVLHLINKRSDYQSERGVMHLTRDLGSDFESRVCFLGTRGNWRTWLSAAGAVRNPAEVDVIHAWGSGALGAAAFGGGRRIIYSPAGDVKPADARWLRAVMHYRAVDVVSPTSSLRKALIRRGVPLDRCHLIRPGVEFAKIRRRRDVQLRAKLGLAEDDFVLLGVGESSTAANHAQALWTAGILHVLDSRYKLLLWGRGNAISSVRKFCTRQNVPDLLHIAERKLSRSVDFEELLPAADMILQTSRGATPTLATAICMAAGLPIVSTVTYTNSELLEDRHTALMVGRSSPRLLAQRVVALRGNPSLQWQISDMARTEAYEYFSLTRFLDQWRTAYRQCAAGERIEVPEPAPGAGLRFHGRG